MMRESARSTCDFKVRLSKFGIFSDLHVSALEFLRPDQPGQVDKTDGNKCTRT